VAVKAPTEKNFRRAKVRPGARRQGLAAWLTWRVARWSAAGLVVLYAAYRGSNLVLHASVLEVRRISVHGNVRQELHFSAAGRTLSANVRANGTLTDAYGEHPDGSPYDGIGVGRAWPLLTGERAHYELAAARRQAAEHLGQAMEAMAGDAGLLAEQVWDSADIPDRELFLGHPSGSAMPLVWAHAEYLKLCRSLWEGRIFDQPPQTFERYLVRHIASDRIVWRFNNKVRAMPANRTLRVETLAPSVVHWSVDGWRTAHDTATRDTTLGVHVVDLDTKQLRAGDRVELTFYWPEAVRWEGADFVVCIES